MNPSHYHVGIGYAISQPDVRIDLKFSEDIRSYKKQAKLRKSNLRIKKGAALPKVEL